MESLWCLLLQVLLLLLLLQLVHVTTLCVHEFIVAANDT